MTEQKVDNYILTNGKYYPEDRMVYLKEKLSDLDDKKSSLLMSMSLKDPTVTLIISIFLGYLGIDRFMLGDIGMGIGKLITLGGCGIWWLIDIFLVSKRAKQKNFNNLMLLL